MEAWIGVDLDGTLAYYDGWEGPLEIGAPIPAMVARVKVWLAEGRAVRIFTARAFPQEGVDQSAVVAAITAWSLDNIGFPLPITYMKDFGMVELWDDRAVTVEANTGRPLAPSSRGLA